MCSACAVITLRDDPAATGVTPGAGRAVEGYSGYRVGVVA
jgi:hypothetical protein